MTHTTSTRPVPPVSLSKFFADLPALRTERLVMRRLTVGDAEALYAITGDPETSRYLSWTPHETPAEAAAFVGKFVNAYRSGAPAPWGLEAAGVLVGTCGVIDAHPRHRWVQVSFGVAREHWKKGYATEAVKAAVAALFHGTDVQRIEGLAHSENVGGRRVLAKAGMTCEGVLRQNMFAKGGFHDLAAYSVVRSEWATK